jgi:hypothetical protein
VIGGANRAARLDFSEFHDTPALGIPKIELSNFT